MIDLGKEKFMTVRDVGKHPAVKKFRFPSPCRVIGYTWTYQGCHGVKLDTVKVGRARLTTERALLRFLREVKKREREIVA
jgi:hypothetical protein